MFIFPITDLLFVLVLTIEGKIRWLIVDILPACSVILISPCSRCLLSSVNLLTRFTFQFLLMHSNPPPPSMLLYVGLTACVELCCCLVCFLSATTQRLHHGWILGVETKPRGLWKSVKTMVSCYRSFTQQKYTFTLLCSGLGISG